MAWFDRLMEPGLWTDAARVGASSDDIRGEGKFRLTGDLRVVGHDRVLTTPCAIQRDADHEG